MSRPRWFSSARCAIFGAVAITCAVLTAQAHAGGNRVSAVGGIIIDVNGNVTSPSKTMVDNRLREVRQMVAAPKGAIAAPTELRRISLRRLEAAIAEALKAGDTLPPDIQYLAGLQRIEYVFIYPDQKDIVIAGPAEGWTVNDAGEIVGVTTGRPVLRLEDLLVAMRTVEKARTGGISVSIDPTPEGRQRLQKVLDAQRASRKPLNPRALEPVMKQAFGPQRVTIKGVPTDSHFARMLVAADYRMKRYAMNLEPSPVKGMPSYPQLLKTGVNASTNPRWWMACNYEPLSCSEDKLAWHIKGQGVKALTEDEFVQADGTVKGAGKANNAAQKWADTFTEKFDELCAHDAVFGKLRNMMDMCVAAALIEAYDFRAVADCPLTLMYNPQSDLVLSKWQSPKTISPECSFLRTRKGWTVTASGGVLVESWQATEKAATDNAISTLRNGGANATGWWWN